MVLEYEIGKKILSYKILILSSFYFFWQMKFWSTYFGRSLSSSKTGGWCEHINASLCRFFRSWITKTLHKTLYKIQNLCGARIIKTIGFDNTIFDSIKTLSPKGENKNQATSGAPDVCGRDQNGAIFFINLEKKMKINNSYTHGCDRDHIAI